MSNLIELPPTPQKLGPDMPDGYYQTPNNMIPHNDRKPGEIAEIAIEQLAPYQAAARTWPIGEVYRDHRECNICLVCGQNIWFLYDLQGNLYHYTDEEILALIVAHIRQIHTEVVSGKDATAQT